MNYQSLLLTTIGLAFFSHISIAQTTSESGLVTKPWIGVATSEVPKTLREYLELSEGFGIQITHIPEDSPAAEVGLKPGDILTKFNDQLLISPIHLAILVRAQEKGDSVELTYIRKGAEKVIAVELSEKQVQPLEAIRDSSSRPRPARDITDLISRYYGGADKVPSHYHSNRAKVAVDAVVKIDNENGEAKLFTSEGQRMIEIKNKSGETVYKGPFDQEKGIEGLPEKAQQQLKLMKVEKLDGLFPKIRGAK